ncbi:NAD(P)/FAD-dependent oxidoreductase [Plebeiibacterium marinum]|uniref:FAD-dependent oxidoreductase n=1 Tax=Plebeiibacterium marinum TaxID=2992111 RepID=A0AAE3MI37_9BACT|nr:NAD(P)/FAD-dependent oxidoreductase [Plebeiobacterium marinum]MCW3807497.1 FAD-dependent oxidoreductase [Plebeiobacterium marinum]
MILKDYIIIGGGISGLSAIKAIREEDKDCSVLWITDEDRLPYKRTQINKNIASGFEKDAFALIDHDWLVNNHIELLYDHVQGILTDSSEVSFAHRGHLKYKKLIVAIGNKPKGLGDCIVPEENKFDVYTARHVENIVRSGKKAQRYLVVGAGVEGVETASQLKKMGKDVVLVDRNKQVLKRYLNKKYSDFVIKSTKESGIELLLGVKEINFEEVGEGRYALVTEVGKMEFDVVIAATGYEPNISIAKEAGIACNRGILVNECLQTSSPDIYAAGDVAEHPDGIITGLWHAAEKQGYVAGKNAMGRNEVLTLKPFRMKTEVFGEFYFAVKPKGCEDRVVTEVKGPIERDIYIKDGKVCALLMKNDGDRAKIYQQALMEQWDLDKFHQEIPL